jgi:DNA-binding response OmpR family regulator
MTREILLIDDDVELCGLLKQYLESEGLAAVAVHDGVEGLARALKEAFDLIVLDVTLPGMSGLDVLRQLRAKSNVPVLILTARGDDVDRIVGLELGADDYLAKPFNPRELTARIRAILRRAAAPPANPSEPSRITVGDVELDLGAHTVRQGGRQIELTAVEFSLLAHLLRSAGRVVSREFLADQVLGRKFVAWDRSLDVHVSKLRKKLGGTSGGAERIRTIRGVGYLYAAPAGGE